MAYGGRNQQEYDNNDRGYFAKDEERKSDKAPSHKGKITISEETLDVLRRMAKDGEDMVLFLAGWPAKNKKGMLTLKVEPPMAYREDGGGGGGRDRDDDRPARKTYPNKTRGGGEGTRKRYRDDDDDMDDGIPPF